MFISDYDGNTTLANLEGFTRGSPKFRRFLQREIALWEEIYLDFVTTASDAIVVHYENFRDDWFSEVRRIIHFMPGLETTPLRTFCTYWYPFWESSYRRRRRQSFKENPFDKVMHQRIEVAIERVGRALKAAGHASMPTDKFKWMRSRRRRRRTTAV